MTSIQRYTLEDTHNPENIFNFFHKIYLPRYLTVFCFLVEASSEKAIQPPIYFGIGDQLRFESKLGPNLFLHSPWITHYPFATIKGNSISMALWICKIPPICIFLSSLSPFSVSSLSLFLSLFDVVQPSVCAP